MATATIKIVEARSPELTNDVEGFNFIVLPSDTNMNQIPYVLENNDQQVKISRKLTWRDFTIDMSPFDYKYKKMTGFEVIEYGQYNPNNIEELTPNNTDYCLRSESGVTSTHLSVGTFVPLIYDNVTSQSYPSNVREDDLPITPVYLTPVVTSQPTGYQYVKVRVYYGVEPSTKTKIIYNITSETIPNSIGKYKNVAEIEVSPNTLGPINASEFLRGLLYRIVRLPGEQELTWQQALNSINFPDEEFYQRIFPDLHVHEKGNPLKITIWDNNSRKRIFVNGDQLVNGMSISFTDFNAGYVMFDSTGMTTQDNYEVNFSVMDLLNGVMILKF